MKLYGRMWNRWRSRGTDETLLWDVGNDSVNSAVRLSTAVGIHTADKGFCVDINPQNWPQLFEAALETENLNEKYPWRDRHIAHIANAVVESPELTEAVMDRLFAMAHPPADEEERIA